MFETSTVVVATALCVIIDRLVHCGLQLIFSTRAIQNCASPELLRRTSESSGHIWWVNNCWNSFLHSVYILVVGIYSTSFKITFVTDAVQTQCTAYEIYDSHGGEYESDCLHRLVSQKLPDVSEVLTASERPSDGGISTSETSVNSYQTTQRNIQELCNTNQGASMNECSGQSS